METGQYEPRIAGSEIVDLDSTASLLARLRAGDTSAREVLLARYLSGLQRWAHRRLPVSARDLSDTDDLVQVTLLRALDHLEDFKPRWRGAFGAYLRRILLNLVRDEIRRTKGKPAKTALDENFAATGVAPLMEAIGREALQAYDAALEALPEQWQEAVILRIELGFTHQEVAETLALPSANAARMVVARALVRLAEIMDENG